MSTASCASAICSPFDRRFVHHHPYPLDEAAMIEAAMVLEGEHDFTSFATSDDSDDLGRSKVRRIFSSAFTREGERLIYRVREQRLPEAHGPEHRGGVDRGRQGEHDSGGRA